MDGHRHSREQLPQPAPATKNSVTAPLNTHFNEDGTIQKVQRTEQGVSDFKSR